MGYGLKDARDVTIESMITHYANVGTMMREIYGEW
jgi:hypothetical protein